MFESSVEADHVNRRCGSALDGWGLDVEERRNVLACGIGHDEPGAAVALETRRRHIVDVDRAVGSLVGRESLVPLWFRLPQDALDGLTPLELIIAHVAGLKFVRGMLLREQLERRFG